MVLLLGSLLLPLVWVDNESVTIRRSDIALTLGASGGALLVVGNISELSPSAMNKRAITDGSCSTCSVVGLSTGLTGSNDAELTGGDTGVIVASTDSGGELYDVGNSGDNNLFAFGEGGRDVISCKVK